MINKLINKHINYISELYRKYNTSALYVLFGILTTLVNWVVYTLLLIFFSITISNAIAWFVAVALAFVVNRRYVFKSEKTAFWAVAKEALAFLAARIVSAVVEIGGLPLLIWIGLDQQVFGIEGAVAKAILSVAVVLSNYFFSKKVIFR